MLDEPSLGLAPIIVEEIFNMIEKVRKAETTVLIEQNASIALQISDYAYAIELGAHQPSGTGQELLNSEDVKRAYLWNVRENLQETGSESSFCYHRYGLPDGIHCPVLLKAAGRQKGRADAGRYRRAAGCAD